MAAYTLTVTEEEGPYLNYCVRGDNTAETVRRYLREVVELSRERGCRNLLIEEHLEGPSLPITETYWIVEEAVASLGNSPYQVGFVNTNPEHPWANVQFAGMVAQNRGLLIKVFTSPADGKAWMLATLEPKPARPPGPQKP
jgi:hypothetical protein